MMVWSHDSFTKRINRLPHYIRSNAAQLSNFRIFIHRASDIAYLTVHAFGFGSGDVIFCLESTR
jgi:hypothetical protein